MHLGMTYTELRRLPVRYRTWYVKRLSRYFEERNDARNNKKTEGFDAAGFDKFEKMINQKM
jgi:hypothetical protein